MTGRIEVDRDSAEKGLASLVLTVVELLRQLMERQALRRVEQGDLTDEQVERIGTTLMALEEQMTRLREHFGLSPEDLNLDLGPLGSLLPTDEGADRPGQTGSRPMKASSLVWASASSFTGTLGPYCPDDRMTSSIGSIPASNWAQASGSRRSSWPVARARSQVCMNTSAV